MTWSQDELLRIAAADELHTAPLRDAGKRTAHLHGFGQSSSAIRSTCAHTM